MSYTVIRDTREQQGWWFKPYGDCEGTVTAKLDTGDYSIQGLETTLCIERKRSTGELYKNVMEKRFFAEIERMRQYKHCFLLLEFSFNDVLSFPRNSGIPEREWPKLVQWADKLLLKNIVEFQVEHGLQVVFANDENGGWRYVQSIFKRIYELYGKQSKAH